MENQISIKKNYFFNNLLILSKFVIPLISFPYITRIIGPIGLGKVNFAISIVMVFVLLTSLGIQYYGIREVSKIRENKNKLDILFSELVIINVIIITFILCIFIIFIYVLPKFSKESVLYLIMCFKLVISPFEIEWLFKGLEDYKYITIRSVIIKIIFTFSLFVFIKSEKDYITYALLLVIFEFIINIINIIHSRNYVKFTLKNLQFKKHLKKMITIISVGAVIYLNLSIDKIMIGFLSGEEYVGYYSVAEKLCRILISFITSLSIVLFPRLSYFFKKKEFEKFNQYLNKSFKFILFFSLPIITGLLFYGSDLVVLISGTKYIQSITCLKIMSIILLTVGMANVIGLQLLYIIGEEKKFLIAISIGLCSAIIINFILIPPFKHNGAVIGTILSEIISLTILIFFSWKYMKSIILSIKNLKYIAAIFLLSIILLLNIQIFNSLNIIIRLLIAALSGGTCYIALLYVLKEEICYSIINWVKRKVSAWKQN